MLQQKDIDWLNGYKNKTCINAVYKRPTLNTKHKNTYHEIKGQKTIYTVNIASTGKPILVAFITLKTVYFKTRSITRL